MRTLYLECNMGAAGDMLAASLLELHPEPEKIIKQLNEIGLANVEFKLETSVKCGIQGKHFSVLVGGQEEESCDVHYHCHEHHHHHEDHDDCHCHEHHHEDHDDCHCHEHHHEDHDDCHCHEHHHEHHHDHCCEHSHHHEHDDKCHHHDHCHEHEHCPHRDHHHEGHEHTHHHEHHGLHDIEHLVKDHLNIPEKIKNDIIGVYKIIAEAESQVHGTSIDEIHFHEVGSLDAVADITAVCLLINELKLESIIASPINVGSGQVRCAHGILPVPAPATALILKDVPTYSGIIKSELCTPTGAALLKYFVSEFKSQPVMRVEKIGYGMGKKDFEQANCVRAMLGVTFDDTDQVLELCCNLDDITAEELAFAIERLFEAGALDVYTTPIGMKKSRSGILLSVMCRSENRDSILKLLFKHTTTLGVREKICNRYILKRKIDIVNADDKEVRIKRVSGYGTSRKKIEFDDLAEIARKHNFSLKEARDYIEKIVKKQKNN